MADPVRPDLIAQGRHDVILPFYLVKIVRSEFSVKSLIAHKGFSLSF